MTLRSRSRSIGGHLASDSRQARLAGCSTPILLLAGLCFDSTKKGGSGTLWYLYSKTTFERAVGLFRSRGSDQSSTVAGATCAQRDGRRLGNSPLQIDWQRYRSSLLLVSSDANFWDC